MNYRRSAFFLVVILVAIFDLWLTETPIEGHVPDFPLLYGGTDVATYSLVARDPENKELGIAVQSKFLAVGSVVPWAKAGVGAVATQARSNPYYPQHVLKTLERGEPDDLDDIVGEVLEKDRDRHHRQIGVVTDDGKTFTYTGEACPEWAGGIVGENFVAQGNSLANERVLPAMVEAFKTTEGELGARMIAALEAAEAAGGDRRGKQSAALLIVRKRPRPSTHSARYRDLRVDDHPQPIKELKRLYDLHTDKWPPR